MVDGVITTLQYILAVNGRVCSTKRVVVCCMRVIGPSNLLTDHWGKPFIIEVQLILNDYLTIKKVRIGSGADRVRTSPGHIRTDPMPCCQNSLPDPRVCV